MVRLVEDGPVGRVATDTGLYQDLLDSLLIGISQSRE